MTVTRKTLAQDVAQQLGTSVAQAEKAVAATLESITENLAQGDSITLRGFGTFGTRHRNARPGRNPATGEEVEIPESTAVFFKPGKPLKDAVN